MTELAALPRSFRSPAPPRPLDDRSAFEGVRRTRRRRVGVALGTLVATMLPYSVTFLIGWTMLLVVWIIAGLPVGPGAGLFLAQ